MKMEDAENRVPDEGLEPESDEGGWYFDLPSGAWERQEQKNRQLRQAVRDNIDDQEVEPKSDPFRQKSRGLFGLGRKREDEDPAEREIAGGKWTLNPQSDGETAPLFAMDDPTPSPEFPAPGDSISQDSGWEPVEPSSAAWEPDAPGFAANEEPTDDAGTTADENPLLAAMTTWARTPEAEEDAVAESAHDRELAESSDAAWEPDFAEPAAAAEPADTAGSDTEESPFLAAMSSWARKPADQDDADEPATPAPLPLRLNRRDEEELSPGSEAADEDGPASRWDQVFSASAEESGGLNAMRDWAEGQLDTGAPLPTDESGNPVIPEEFLRPFDWEQEEAESQSLEPQALSETGVPEQEAAPEFEAEPVAAAEPVDEIEPVEDESPAAEVEAVAAAALEAAPAGEPAPLAAESPQESEAAEVAGDDWESMTFAEDDPAAEWPTLAVATAAEPARPEKKRGLFGRLFGRKKQDPESTDVVRGAADDDSAIHLMARGMVDDLTEPANAENDPALAAAAAAGWVPVEEEVSDAVSFATDETPSPEPELADPEEDNADEESLTPEDATVAAALDADESPADEADEPIVANADDAVIADTELPSASSESTDNDPQAEDDFVTEAAAPTDTVAEQDDPLALEHEADAVFDHEFAPATEAETAPDDAFALPEAADAEPDVTFAIEHEAETGLDDAFASIEEAATEADDAVAVAEEAESAADSFALADEPDTSTDGAFALDPETDATTEQEATVFDVESDAATVEPGADSPSEETDDDWEAALVSVFGAYDDRDDKDLEPAAAAVADLPVESNLEMVNDEESSRPEEEQADSLAEAPQSLEDESAPAAEPLPFAPRAAAHSADVEAAGGDVDHAFSWEPDATEAAPEDESSSTSEEESVADGWEPLTLPQPVAEQAPVEEPEPAEPLPPNVVPLEPARAATAEEEDEDDPWASFIAARRASGESFPKGDVPADSNPAGWDTAISGTLDHTDPVTNDNDNEDPSAKTADGPDDDAWGHLYGRLTSDEPAEPAHAETAPASRADDAANDDDDDPWADVAAASGYGGEPSDVAIYREPGSAPAANSDADHAVTPPSPPAWAPEEGNDENDVVLQAFYQHANSDLEESDGEPESESVDEAETGLQEILGEHAAELVSEVADPVDGSYNRMQGWVPQRGVAPEPVARGWQPHDDEDEEENWPSDEGGFGEPIIGLHGGDDDHPPARSAVGSRSKPIVREIVETVLLAVLVFLCVRASFQNFKVDGTSMAPTLDDGQFLIVNKLVYSEVDTGKLARFIPFLDADSGSKKHVFHGPERGDIIVMVNPSNTSEDLIKRVIGLPGETIEISNGEVYINDLLLEEPYIKDPWNYNMPKMRITEGTYFVMGDNRQNSWDSRFAQVGLIPEDYIIGKAMFSYWPRSHFGLAPNESPSLAEQKPRLTTQRIGAATAGP